MELEKNYSLPYFPLPKHTPKVAFVAPNLPDLNIDQQRDGVGGILNPIPPPYLKDSQYALSRGLDAPQKRFFIFDQSGNDTRLFFSPAFPHQDRIFLAPRLGHPTVEEKWDENDLTSDGEGEGEMLEDTEEIDALLYSDSDYDEVTSIRHTPFRVDDEPLDQVASSDESPKRQRLVDGKYKKSSLENGGGYLNDVESSCCAKKGANKVKIRQALKILETIIPGLDNKDPPSIIDEAVAYLKSMKTEAEALESS